MSTLPYDSVSLIAAWEAINPCQPLPTETHGILLNYFKRVELTGERMLAPADRQGDFFASPPSRFVRQPRANKRPPSGPAGTSAISNSDDGPSCMPQDEKNVSEHSDSQRVCLVGIDFVVTSLVDDEIK